MKILVACSLLVFALYFRPGFTMGSGFTTDPSSGFTTDPPESSGFTTDPPESSGFTTDPPESSGFPTDIPVVDPCCPNPCGDNAYCRSNNYTDYYCQCEYGYTGDGYTCTDIDECQNANTSCGNGDNRICFNTRGGYYCECEDGYYEDYHNYTYLCFPCGDNVTCPENARCTAYDGEDVHCDCRNGYEGYADNCTDIDECRYNDCGPYEECYNTNGSYYCDCRDGFARGDRGYCTDINECDSDDYCYYPNATCINTNGNYRCACVDGYYYNGSQCISCNMTCHEYGECYLTDSYDVGCRCKYGYEEDGVGYCNDIDECERNETMCDRNAYCVNTNGSYSCYCKTGFTGDGYYCTDINECECGSPCADYAYCYNNYGSYDCRCEYGFTGDGYTYCEDIDECKYYDYCDGDYMVCNNTAGSYYCSCIYGFYFSHSLDQCIALDDDVLRYPPYVIEGRRGCDPYYTEYRIRNIHYDVRDLLSQQLQREDDY